MDFSRFKNIVNYSNAIEDEQNFIKKLVNYNIEYTKFGNLTQLEWEEAKKIDNGKQEKLLKTIMHSLSLEEYFIFNLCQFKTSYEKDFQNKINFLNENLSLSLFAKVVIVRYVEVEDYAKKEKSSFIHFVNTLDELFKKESRLGVRNAYKDLGISSFDIISRIKCETMIFDLKKIINVCKLETRL